MKRRFKLSTPIGTASILLVFMVLCLVSFASLSLVNANADQRLTTKLADHTSAYYQAVNAAEDYIMGLDLSLQKIYDKADSEESFLLLSQALNLEKDFPITELQYLHVELVPHYPDSKNKQLYSIETYQVITNDSELEYNTSLPVVTK